MEAVISSPQSSTTASKLTTDLLVHLNHCVTQRTPFMETDAEKYFTDDVTYTHIGKIKARSRNELCQQLNTLLSSKLTTTLPPLDVINTDNQVVIYSQKHLITHDNEEKTLHDITIMTFTDGRISSWVSTSGKQTPQSNYATH